MFSDSEWRSFCEVIGHTALADNPRFATLAARKRNEDELDQLVNEWTSSLSAEEVMSLMQAGGVSAGVVQNAHDQADDPQLNARRFFWELDNPTLGKFVSPAGIHFLMSKAPVEVRPPPLLGQHNDYVFKEILGMSQAEYGALLREKVID